MPISRMTDLNNAQKYTSEIVIPTVAAYAPGYWGNISASASNPNGSMSIANIPGSAFSPNSIGMIKVPKNIDPAKSLYLVGAKIKAGFATVQNQYHASLWLADVLWAAGGINATIGTVQPINTGALPRYSTGDGVECWLQNQTTMTTNAVVSVSATNQSGNAASLQSVSLGGSSQAGLMAPVPMGSSSDTGIRSVESVTMSTPVASGTLSVLLLKRLVEIPITSQGVDLDFLQCMIKLAGQDSELPALMMMAIFGTTGGSPLLHGRLTMAVA